MEGTGRDVRNSQGRHFFGERCKLNVSSQSLRLIILDNDKYYILFFLQINLKGREASRLEASRPQL